MVTESAGATVALVRDNFSRRVTANVAWLPEVRLRAHRPASVQQRLQVSARRRQLTGLRGGSHHGRIRRASAGHPP